MPPPDFYDFLRSDGLCSHDKYLVKTLSFVEFVQFPDYHAILYMLPLYCYIVWQDTGSLCLIFKTTTKYHERSHVCDIKFWSDRSLHYISDSLKIHRVCLKVIERNPLSHIFTIHFTIYYASILYELFLSPFYTTRTTPQWE